MLPFRYLQTDCRFPVDAMGAVQKTSQKPDYCRNVCPAHVTRVQQRPHQLPIRFSRNKLCVLFRRLPFGQ